MKTLFAGLVLATVAAAQPAPSYKNLQFPPLRQVRIPDIVEFKLPNGMRVYLLENHELPLIGGTALVRTGNLLEPADKVGLAQITGSVLRSGGTKSKTGDELDLELENRAASVESGIGETSGSVSFGALKENIDEVLAIFKDVLTNPEFRQDKIDLEKLQLRGVISRRNDNAGGIASREFTQLLYGPNTPYGRELEYEHLDRITRDDLIAFYKRYFFPANIMLAVRGDFKAPEMRARLEKLFADWTYSQPAVPEFPPVSAKPTPGAYLAVKEDVNQTFFRMGHLGGLLKDKDYAALQVMGDILGGGFSSRLFQKIRTELGYAYGVGAAWGAEYNHPGIFRISGSTKSESTVDTLNAIRQEVERLRTTEVTPQELETAKQTVLNGFVFNFDTPTKTLNRIITYEYYGYPRDFLMKYQAAIDAVTRADVLRVAKERLNPADFTIVAVANPKLLGKPLTELGEVKTIDLTIPEPKREAAKSDAASLGAGKKLLARMQAAMGGGAALAAVKDLIITADIEFTTGQGTIKAGQTLYWIAPSVLRQEQQLPFGKIIAFYDGKEGWLQSPQGNMPLPPPIVRQVQGALLRMWPTLALSDRASGRTVNLTGPGLLEITEGPTAVRIQVDEKTGLPAKLLYQTVQMTGAPAEVEELIIEWRDAGGIKFPAKTVINQGGKKFAEVTVTDIKVNSSLKLEELAKKP
jgi:zinc protease